MGEVNDAFSHRNIDLSRGVGDRGYPRTFRKLFLGQFQTKTHQFKALRDLSPSARIGEHRLVAMDWLRAHHRVVAEPNRRILRRGGRAEHVDYIERLLKFQRFFVIKQRTRSPSAFQIGRIRASGAGHEQHCARFERLFALGG